LDWDSPDLVVAQGREGGQSGQGQLGQSRSVGGGQGRTVSMGQRWTIGA